VLPARAIARYSTATIRRVSELVLIASDIYRAAIDVPRSAGGASLPGLSRIARYGTVEPVPAGWRAGIADALGRADLASAAPATIAGAAAVAGNSGRAPETPEPPFLWLADPVHLIVGPTSVHLAADGRLALDADTQQALARAFDAAFAQSGYRLEPLRGGRFLARGPAPLGEVEAMEPARALGARIADALPKGRGAGKLRTLGAEIEMWLHEHPLNAQRARERRPPISTLWFWGGGPALGATPGSKAPQTSSSSSGDSRGAVIFGDDPFMEGLARLCGARFAGAPEDGVPRAPGEASRRIVALEVLRSDARSAEGSVPHREPVAALERFERDWVAPALEQLRRGELARLTIFANDRRLSIGAHDRFRLWRRRRAALAVLR